jgi:hypothetical protein
MARYVCKIGSLQRNTWPDPDSVKNYFLQYSENAWMAGGGGDASFIAYGVDGTDGAPPYTSRIDARLGIWDHPKLGFCIYFSKSGGGVKEHFYSLRDENDLATTVETRNGDSFARGLFVSGEEAWKAVEDFLTTKGTRSSRIKWVADSALP